MGRSRVAVALAAVGIALPEGRPLLALTPTPSATVPPARAAERRPHPWVPRGNTTWLAQGQGLATRRSALVIGNADYKEEALANGVNDADEVARTLREIGFAVTLVRNADLPTMEEAVEAFSRQLGPGDIGLFYYSGHGVQVNGSNYLVPINAKLNRESDVKVYAYPLAIALNALEDANVTSRIIILDACRDNPFYRRWRSSNRSISASRGLATQLPSGSGTLIAFSTGPDQVAADRLGSSRNSPFTTHLLRHLRTPNLEVKELFRRVRKDVVLSTRDEQIPWVNESLVEEVVLNPRRAPLSVALGGVQATIPPQLPTVAPVAAAQRASSPAPGQLSALASFFLRHPLPSIGTAPTRSLVYELKGGHRRGDLIQSLAFSSDGRRIVSGSTDNTLRLWDAATGKPIGLPLQGHTSYVTSVAFSPSGKRIVSGSSDNTLRLWDTATGKPIGLPLRGHTNNVKAVVFSPDGQRIISVSEDSTLRVWDAGSGQPIGPPTRGHRQNRGLLSVAIRGDGQRLVSGSADGSLSFWDGRTLLPASAPSQGHMGWVRAVAFSPDGRRVVSGSADQTVRLWDAASGKTLGPRLQGHTDQVMAVAFSSDGRRFVSAGGESLHLWDAFTGRSLGVHRPCRVSWGSGYTSVESVAFSPAGGRLALSCWGGALQIWNSASMEPMGFPP